MQCSEFCDGFALHKSLIANEGLLLHATTVQSRDSTCNSSIHTYPVALGNKSKDSIIIEITCADYINNRENPTMTFKVRSKQHKSFVYAVLSILYMALLDLLYC